MSDDLNIIAKLDDEPNDVGGLTADELKAEFDRAGLALQSYLNEVLLPGLQESGGANIQIDGRALADVLNGLSDTLAGLAERVSGHAEDRENPHGTTKEQVGLGQADNTSDQDKPVSRAQQTALDAKADRAEVIRKGAGEDYTPAADGDPANKRYVDQVAAGVALGQIPDKGVTSTKLADGSVTSAKLAEPLQDWIAGQEQTDQTMGQALDDQAKRMQELEEDVEIPYRFTELDDVEAELGTFVNAGAGWNTQTFRRAFAAAPQVVCQALEHSGWVEVKSVTAEHFLYCVRAAQESGGTATTADAVTVQYLAMEDGGER